MARIPLGDPDMALGGRVAQPQRGVLPTAREMGAGVGQALEQAGAVGMQVVDQQQREADALRRQQEAEARQQQREANRVKALTVTARVQNELNTLNDEISQGLADGTLDKDKVSEQWQARSQAIMQGGLDGIDDEHRPLVEATLADNLNTASRTVTRLVQARDKADQQQGTNAYLEEMQRYAARGGAQADEAIANVAAFIPSVAGRAGLDAQKTVQAFKERVRFRQAADLVLADPAAALKQLRNKDAFPELDPDRRGALIAQADAAVLRAQERARIEAERQAREQDRVFTAAAAVFESGRAFSAEYGDQVLARLKGSPYESTVREMIKAGPQNAAAATLPIDVQRAQLDGLLARANTEGSNPALNQEIERRQKVLQAAERDIREDPLGAANERGIVPVLRPLNVADLSSLPGALADRLRAAQTAATWAKQPVSPLRPAEAEQLSQTIRSLPTPQRAATVEMLAQSVNDPQMLRAMAAQIAGKDQTLATAFVLAADGNRTTAGRSVTELYLRGAEVIQTRENKGERERERRTAQTIRGNMVQAVGDAYFSPQARDLYVDAAVKVQAALQAEGDGDADERAVRLVTGGVVTRGGRQVVKPYGWTDREFDDWLGKTRDTLRADKAGFVAAGVRISGEQLAVALPNSRMASVGAGQYVIVGHGGQIVRRPDGSPLILDSAR